MSAPEIPAPAERDGDLGPVIAKRMAELAVAARANKALGWFDEYAETALAEGREGIRVQVSLIFAGACSGAVEAQAYLHAALSRTAQVAMEKAIEQARADLALAFNPINPTAECVVRPADGTSLPYGDGWRIVRSINPDGPNPMILWERIPQAPEKAQ